MSEQTAAVHRYRLVYSRGNDMRYVSLLDMQLVWERTMRRARLPVAYSQGFSPRPRFHIAAALPLGFTSRCEIADVWLNGEFAPVELVEKLQASAPPGMSILSVEEVELSLPAIQTRVTTAEYRVVFLEQPESIDLQKAVEDLLAATSIPRTRREKQYDLRPLIQALELKPPENADGKPCIWMRLSVREGATGRPEEVLSALGLDYTMAHAERLKLILEG